MIRVLSRCLRSKCPVCGQGRLFASPADIRNFSEIFLPLKKCSACGFRFSRQPGYYFGAVTPILPILALMTGTIFAGVSYFGLHQELDAVIMSGATGVILGFILLFRTAIAIYIALDHAVDPPESAHP
ncbi:MAG: hypothetical protein P4M08_03310 [Oligoflexia bacterium]|nr:hypothetical protein [Oligoflexia bacterium]